MQLKKNATKQKWLKNFKFCYFIGLAVHEVLCECFLCEEAGGQELDYPRHVRPQYRSGAVERLPGVSTLLFCVTSYCQSTAGLRAAAGLSNHK